MSQMPVFGPGPGQYQGQTTFNPTLQPTVQVEQKQSLFAQIAGLVPLAAETASKVIDVGTRSKIQSYQEREAAAKLEATNNNDLKILENFYQTEMATTGIQPPAIRTAATEGLTGVKQTILKYNEELKATAAKQQEEFLKQQSETEMQWLDVALEQTNYLYRVEGNIAIAAEQLSELSKKFDGNPKATEKIIAAQTKLGEFQNAFIDKQNEANQTALQDRRSKAAGLVGEASTIVSDNFKNNVQTQEFVKTNGFNGVVNLIGRMLQATNPDPRIVWNPDTGLPDNDPVLSEEITRKALRLTQSFGGEIQKNVVTEQQSIRINNLEQSIQFGPKYFAQSLNNAYEFANTLLPQDKVKYISEIEQSINKTITGLSSQISSASSPQELFEASYNLQQVLQATPNITRTAGTSEALNRLYSSGRKAMESLVLSGTAKSFTGANPSEHVKEWLTNQDGSLTNSTVGDFILIDELRQMIDPTNGTPIFSEQELNKILVTGDFATALTDGQDPAKDRIIQVAIDTSQSFRDKTNTDKEGKPKATTTAEQLTVALQSGVKIGDLKDKLTSPSQQLRNPVVVNNGIVGLESFGFTADRIKELTTSVDPKDQNDQFRLYSIVANQDKQFYNNDNPTKNYVQQIAADLSSTNPSDVIRGISLFHGWGGFTNPAVRSYLRTAKDSELTDVQLIQLAHVAKIVDKDGNVSVPGGGTIINYLQKVATVAEPGSSKRESMSVKDMSKVYDDLGMSGIALSAREKDFIKTSVESTKALYPNSDYVAVVKTLLETNGFKTIDQADGSKNLYVDPYGYYVKQEDRDTVLNRVFNQTIPERHKEAYRKHFGLSPNQKFTTFGDILAYQFGKMGLDKEDMYDLDWNLSFDEENMMTFFKTAPGNMSPDYQLTRGGTLQYWDERESVWKTIYAGDNLTEIRITNDSLQFPSLKSNESVVKAMTVQERQIAKMFNKTIRTTTRSR